MRSKRILICTLLVFIMSLAPLNYSYGYDSNIIDGSHKAIEDAVDYLHDMQNDDGGFPAKQGRKSSVAVTCWSVSALVAAGEDVESNYWKPAGKGPVEYILNTDNELEDTVEYVRILLALSAAGRSPEYKGESLEDKIVSFQQSDGHFAQLDRGEDLMINSHMWSIIALESAGNEDYDREKAREWLTSNQNDDGGFGWLSGGESDSDDTAVALQALVLLGEDKVNSSAIEKALDFIKSRQEDDGGFSSSEMMGDESNSASDAWVMQGIISAGEEYTSSFWSVENGNVKTHLMDLQNNDGSFDWKEGVSSSQVKMTAYSIISLSNKPFPVNVDFSELKTVVEMFTDLAAEHWAYDSISFLVEENVINGYPDGSFKPEGSVKRAEFTSMSVKGLNFENDSYSNGLTFKDVDGDLWSYKYIAIAYKKGIINGRSSETFDPDGLITGAELATMLVNIMPDGKKTHIEDGEYWYSGYVSLAEKYDLLYPGFKANETATRAQCAYSIKRIIEFIK